MCVCVSVCVYVWVCVYVLWHSYLLQNLSAEYVLTVHHGDFSPGSHTAHQCPHSPLYVQNVKCLNPLHPTLPPKIGMFFCLLAQTWLEIWSVEKTLVAISNNAFYVSVLHTNLRYTFCPSFLISKPLEITLSPLCQSCYVLYINKWLTVILSDSTNDLILTCITFGPDLAQILGHHQGNSLSVSRIEMLSLQMRPQSRSNHWEACDIFKHWSFLKLNVNRNWLFGVGLPF